ncbi:MAG: hypothetical protein MK165_08265 [Pirellulaceae bacterium]|nr:hypothetical protein [Pirellulaceae bacterium]
MAPNKAFGVGEINLHEVESPVSLTQQATLSSSCHGSIQGIIDDAS